MDYLRGFTSSSLDTAQRVLTKQIKAKDEEEAFRPHSSRDMDDCLDKIVDAITAANNAGGGGADGGIPQIMIESFMLIAGERAARIQKDVEEYQSKEVAKVVVTLEKFMQLPRRSMLPAHPHQETPVSQDGANAAGNNNAKDDKNKLPVLPTFFANDTSLAIAVRNWAVAVRFYGEWTMRIAVNKNPSAARRAIHCLNSCIESYRPGPGHLTPAHAVLAEICLKTHHAYVAVPRLEEPIYELNPNTSGVGIFDYCDFYYFGGLCFASLREFAQSAEMLEQVLLAPARGLSIRAVAAAKAHLLVTCIHTGEGSLPMSIRMFRPISELTRDYQAFVDSISKAITTRNYDAAASYRHPGDAENDGLNPLCVQCVHAVPSHRARNLTQTYKSVTLQNLAKECGSDVHFAENQIGQMVRARAFDCNIDQAKGVVTFSDVVPSSLSSSSNGVGGGLSSSSPDHDDDGTAAVANREQEALKAVMEVNKLIAQRQDETLVSPGTVLANAGNIQAKLEVVKKEMDTEKGGGMLGMFRR